MKIKLLSALLIALFIQACGSKTTNENEAATESQEQVVVEEKVETMQASAVSSEQLESMLSSYFSLKDALVNTSAEEAKTAASTLLKNLTDSMGELKTLVSEMESKDDVEAIRADFEKLSSNMYQMVKDNADKVEGKVYKQYCPMAFNNKGAFWLSSKEEIRNPYFGDKMLKCGKVQEEL